MSALLNEQYEPSSEGEREEEEEEEEEEEMDAVGDGGGGGVSGLNGDDSSGGAGESIRDRSVSRAQEEFDAEYDLPSTEWFQTFGPGGAKVKKLSDMQ